MNKVIRGDAATTDSPHQFEKPALRPPPRAGVVNAEEFEARTTAKDIIAEANKRADEIKADAEREKERVFAKAAEDAKAEVMSKASEEIARAKMQAGQILADSEKDIIELAIKIAAKIIGRDLERDPEIITEICATATEHARAAKAMILRVNPKDGALLREKKPKLMEQIGRTLELAIRDDADIEPGGCLIQTEFGTIDAQLKTQFDMLRNVLYPDGAKKDVK
ncbi:MAG: flagellar assembly protein FliH [Myxococcaceae bacterium]|nr:flagellar assembly protein FliH [Myxococcaceae bacterium]